MIYSELKDDTNTFLKNYAVWIAVDLVVVIIATILIIFVIKNGKKKGQKVIEDHTRGSDWLKALGEKDNILEVTATGSRLTVRLKDQSLVNKEQLKTLGVTNIVTMSDKLVLVVEDKAELIKEKLN